MKYDKKEVFESIVTKATSLSPEKKEEARAWLLSKIREKKTLKNGKERLLTTQQIQSEFYKTFFPQIRTLERFYPLHDFQSCINATSAENLVFPCF